MKVEKILQTRKLELVKARLAQSEEEKAVHLKKAQELLESLDNMEVTTDNVYGGLA